MIPHICALDPFANKIVVILYTGERNHLRVISTLLVLFDSPSGYSECGPILSASSFCAAVVFVRHIIYGFVNNRPFYAHISSRHVRGPTIVAKHFCEYYSKL